MTLEQGQKLLFKKPKGPRASARVGGVNRRLGRWLGWLGLPLLLLGAWLVWQAEARPTLPAAGQQADVSAGAVPQASAAQGVQEVQAAPPSPAPAPPAVPAQVPCLGAAPAVPKAPPPPYPLSGRLGLWVAEVDPQTLQVKKAVGTNPNSVFPLASTYKQAVLWAVLREFDAGRISPVERLDVTEANRSLGQYPYDGTTVRALTDRMIKVSDNTATDMLHRRVGLERVQAVADGLGLCQTRLVMPTKTWWVIETGLSRTALAFPDWWQRPERLQLAQRIDAEAQAISVETLSPKLDTFFDERHTPADDLQAHNLSTPYEFATLLAHEYLAGGLSERAARWRNETAALGYGRAALRAEQAGNLQTFYGKGGNGWRLLTYTGYFQTRDGHHVMYAFMQHGADELYTMPNTHRAFGWINAAVDEVIGPQRPKPKLPEPKKEPEKKKLEKPEVAPQVKNAG